MSRINIITLVVFGVVLVWIFLFSPDTIRVVQRGALAVFAPMMSSSEKLERSIDEFGDDGRSPRELRKRLDVLERESALLRLENERLHDLTEENRALRQALNYVENSPLNLVSARVINRKGPTWYHTLIIDQGSRSNITVDSPVIVPVDNEAALVGKVSQVGEDSSVVILLSDEVCQVSARVMGTTEQGILSGQRGALNAAPELKLRYISKDAAIAPGDTVISSGVGGVFPGNLLLGEIKEFSRGAIDGEAVVISKVNFALLKNVFVVSGLKE
ncbi:MAG: rod shape-determining protein MreC [Verrucomicrobiales bacterium]|nr:rod shape-determining protein MreC [Verrucomicrobiales bacterium]